MLNPRGWPWPVVASRLTGVERWGRDCTLSGRRGTGDSDRQKKFVPGIGDGAPKDKIFISEDFE